MRDAVVRAVPADAAADADPEAAARGAQRRPDPDAEHDQAGHLAAGEPEPDGSGHREAAEARPVYHLRDNLSAERPQEQVPGGGGAETADERQGDRTGKHERRLLRGLLADRCVLPAAVLVHHASVPAKAGRAAPHAVRRDAEGTGRCGQEDTDDRAVDQEDAAGLEGGRKQAYSALLQAGPAAEREQRKRTRHKPNRGGTEERSKVI